MDEIVELLAGRDERIELDRAALLLATIEFPDLDIRPFLELLDSHARELSARLQAGGDGLDYIAAANEYLFSDLGFRGNAEDYYNPRNSCLNEVLTNRAGIPISLSVVYMEISRRLGRRVHGIGLPGHFIVQYDDGDYDAYIDPFHGGCLLTAQECRQLAKEVTGAEVSDDPQLLAPAGKRQIVARMLNNLRAIYVSRRAFGKALQVLDLMVAADPSEPEGYRQRGLLHIQLERLAAARADLERYLALAPGAPDRKEIEKQVNSLKQWIAGMN